MDMRFLMKQAQQMQNKLQEAQQSIQAVGTAGGESVKVTLNGAKELKNISVTKDAMDHDDPSLLEDLIMVAFNDASLKVDAEMARVTGNMTSGLNIPGFKF
jgi:DNA-binding YbaB/EbfC family protein